MRAELGWNADRVNLELADFRQIAQRYTLG
jgi:hypothetical protein